MSQPKVELNSTLNNLDKFNKYAASYDDYAHVQKDVAYELYQFIKQHQTFFKKNNASILEIGAGTGLFTQLHLDLWSSSEVDITEPQLKMLHILKSKILKNNSNKIKFIQQDLNRLVATNKKYDIILHSYVAQWFKPVSEFSKQFDILSDTGVVVFSLPIKGSFQIWEDMSNKLGVPFTANVLYTSQQLIDAIAQLNGIEILDYKIKDYYSHVDNAIDFFKEIKYIGAGTQDEGISLNSKDFIKLIKHINSKLQLGEKMNYKSLFILAKKK